MALVFLLSLHLFLMTGYAVLVETNKSRLNYGYLIFALFIPFVGELCLLAADFGKSPASYEFVKPFKTFSFESEDKKRNITLDKNVSSRSELLEIIKTQPENLTDILKSSLKSDDTEIVHIAASSIMKLQRDYENKIKFASEQYEQMPNNMELLKKYIVSIGEYHSQGLLTNESALSLLMMQEELLKKYLQVLPEDKEVGILSIKNSILQGDFEQALNKSEFMRYLFLSDISIWNYSIQICLKMKNIEKMNQIINEADKMSVHWTLEQKAQWNNIQKGLDI